MSILRSLPVVILLLTAPLLARGQDFDAVQIQAISVRDGIHMLVGRGGNIGVSAGEDGVFLIDDQFAPLTEKIRAAVQEIDARPIRFLLNTHWHGDHTGGNENLGKAGVLIMAHDGVRARMSVEQVMAAFDRKVPPAPKDALPVVTFNDALTLHLNGDEIHAFHVSRAHTDGDSIVHFRRANVVHTGDTYFNGIYPFIDVGSDGSIDGTIAAVERVLALSNDDTKIIPGHGPLSNLAELTVYRDMLKTVRARVQQAIEAGSSADRIVAEKPTAEFDAEWGDGFVKPEQFVRRVHADLAGVRP